MGGILISSTTRSPAATSAKRNSIDAYHIIRQAIIEGAVKPLERLTEERWAKELGISRTPVRDVLLTLEAEGLVTLLPNRGAVVRRFSKDEILEIYELRAVLEGYAARKAATLITKEELTSLRRIADEMEASSKRAFSSKAEEVHWIVSQNNEFHRLIARTCRNERLQLFLKTIIEVPLVFRAYFWYGRKERILSNHYHRQLILSLGNGDGKRAELLMEEHIYEGRDFILAKLKAQGGAGA